MRYEIGDIVEIKDGTEYSVTRPGTQWVVYGYWHVDGTRLLLLKIGRVPKNYEEFESLKEIMVDSSAGAFLKRTECDSRRYSVMEEEVTFVGKMGVNKDFKELLSQEDAWEQPISRYGGRRVSPYVTTYVHEASDDDLPF